MDETLSTKHKIVVVLGLHMVTPLLGAVLYYVWKERHPRKARFANISSFCVLALFLFVYPTLIAAITIFVQENRYSSQLAAEMSQIHPSEKDALTAIYDGIDSYGSDEAGHVTAVQYQGFSLRVIDGDKELAHLSQFPRLNSLALPLAGFEFTNEGLKELSTLAELESLIIFMSEEVMNDRLQVISGISTLKELGLVNNSVDDEGMKHDEGMRHIAKLTDLESLDVLNLNLTDSGINALGTLQKLVTLRIKSTGIIDESLEMIANLPRLEHLDISGSDVTDEGLRTLSKSKSLKRLVAFKNEHGGGLITKAGLEHLRGIATLEHIYLRGFEITDSDAAALQELLPDCEIQFDYSEANS